MQRFNFTQTSNENQNTSPFIKLRWQSRLMWQYHEFSLDVGIKLIYTDNASLVISS